MKHVSITTALRLMSLTTVLSTLVVVGTPQTAHASVDDFKISSYDIAYTLSRDTDNRSHLHTVETITANFPEVDQNHGIERAIPTSYDGHPTHLKLVSITDGNSNIPYTTYTQNHHKVYRIGSADTYVHGQKTYTITYDQQDVTKDYSSSTKAQEFYWDTNGTQWRVPIDKLHVGLQLAGHLQPLEGRTYCYQGTEGSNTPCDVLSSGDTHTVTAHGLNPGENVTLTLGFKPSTFAIYKPTLLDNLISIWHVLLVVTLPVAVALVIWLLRRYHQLSYRKGERDTIVPEYAPPAGSSIPLAGKLTNSTNKSFGAFLLDLAVRGYIKIYELDNKMLWMHRKDYELEIICDLQGLQTEEIELLSDVFAQTTKGQRLRLSEIRKNNRVIAARLTNNPKALQTSMRTEYALQAKDPAKSQSFYRTGNVLLVLALCMVSPWLALAAACAYACGLALWPLTDKGLLLHQGLEGLKLYIKTAEADRLAYLQSPETAQKLGNPIDPNDKRQLLHLYERALPYAVLFGVEKQWSKQLGEYYNAAQAHPAWYVGTTPGFNALAFGTALSSFTSATTYTSAGNAASGGSTGGGSSGGGGGGGGGGGW